MQTWLDRRQGASSRETKSRSDIPAKAVPAAAFALTRERAGSRCGEWAWGRKITPRGPGLGERQGANGRFQQSLDASEEGEGAANWGGGAQLAPGDQAGASRAAGRPK